jgi:putative FmdB family regulatory protein
MATYEYLCSACGPFCAARPMAESSLPQPCPVCATPSPRAWITPPAFAGMSATRRHAYQTNERASHEPRVASQTDAGTPHRPGCSCCSGKASRSTHVAPGGEKSFPNKRPWMISH